MKALLACVLLLAGGIAWAQHDPFRPGTGFEQDPKTAPLVNAENDDRKRVRSYAMQPPTIPTRSDGLGATSHASGEPDFDATRQQPQTHP